MIRATMTNISASSRYVSRIAFIAAFALGSAALEPAVACGVDHEETLVGEW